jgi:type VI secretion system protein ImpL
VKLPKQWSESAVAPLVGALVGVIAIAAVAYAMGWWGRLGASVSMWFWVGLFFALALAVVVSVLWLLPLYRERRFVERLRSADSQTPQAELEDSHRQLREKMLEAIRTLQRSPDHKKRALYALPWYLLIGTHQSGKTALLQGVASLFAPFARQSSAGSPTQNCDWWFFNTAVVLDTSGRYAFPTEVEHDSALWYRLLQLLRHYRERLPIDGVIVAVAADALAMKTLEELRLDAVELRRRLDEVTRELGVDAPVYVLITRCDLIEGFTEFFGCLPEQTREQAFGFVNETPPQRGDQASARPLESMLAALDQRLHQLRLSMFNEEKVPPALLRQKIFCFPEEFSALQQPLKTFLEALLAENPVQRTPFFRGLFFCSAQRQGTPVSFLRRELSFKAPIDGPEVGARNYFLHDLFSVILPRGRYLARPTAETSRGWLLKHLLGSAACLGLCLLLALPLTQAFLSDQRTAVSAAEVECEAADEAPGRGPLVDEAENCRRAVEELITQNRQRPSWSKLVFDRSVKLEEGLRVRYAAKFKAEALAPLDTAIAQRLTTDAEVIALVFLLLARTEALKQCLAATGCPETLDGERQPDYRVMLASGSRPSPMPEDVAKLQNAYETYLRWSSGMEGSLRGEYEALTVALRRWLSSKEVAPRQILLWANRNHQALTYQELWDIPLPAGDPNSPQVGGAFTHHAWEQSLAPLLKRAGEAVPDVEPVLKGFQAHYRAQYVTQWQRFLARFPQGAAAWEGTRERRLQLASRLLDAGSPFDRVLDIASANLKVLDATALPSERPSATESATPAWVGVLHRYVGSDSRRAYVDSLREVGKRLTGEARREHSFQLAQAGFQEGTPTEKSDHPVLRAWWIVGQLREKDGPDAESPEAAFWQLLQWPVLFVWRVILEEASAYLQERWNELLIEVKDLPPGQKHEVLYGKGGKVGAFVAGPATSFLSRRGDQYAPRRVLQGEVAFMETFLQYLQQARVGGAQPEMEDVKRRIPIRAAPAAIEADATLKVAKTELIVECDTGRQVLEAADSGADRTFIWTVKSCFDTSLRVYVADSAGQPLGSLERRYAGLAQFLEHFSGFQRTFRLPDFTVENGAQLAPYRIRAVTLRYRYAPEDRQQILRDLEAYRRYEGNIQARLELPAKIVAISP